MAASRRKPATPEGAVQAPCLKLLALRGYPVLRINSGALRDRTGRLLFLLRDHLNRPWKGVSDVLSFSCVGRFLAFEVKAPKGKPTPEQLAFLVKVQRSGGVAVVVRDVAVLTRVLDALARDPWARFTIDGELIQQPTGASPDA
jgi:hypothetical protein